MIVFCQTKRSSEFLELIVLTLIWPVRIRLTSALSTRTSTSCICLILNVYRRQTRTILPGSRYEGVHRHPGQQVSLCGIKSVSSTVKNNRKRKWKLIAVSRDEMRAANGHGSIFKVILDEALPWFRLSPPEVHACNLEELSSTLTKPAASCLHNFGWDVDAQGWRLKPLQHCVLLCIIVAAPLDLVVSPEVNVTETRSHSRENVWATIEFSCSEGSAVEETFASSSLIRAQYVHQGALVSLTSVNQIAQK